MQSTALITEASGTGYAYLVRIPYRHMPFVSALKATIPESGRDWHPRLSAWLFRRAHLEAVRQLVAQYAESERWRVIDTTTMETEQSVLALQELDLQEHEAHVAAALDVLPKLPANALTLIGWFSDVIALDLDTYLGDTLFQALIAAQLPDRKFGNLPYTPSKNSKTVRIFVAPDSRIVSSLLAQKIQHLSLVSDLTITATFDDGVTHWHDQHGSLWFGAPSAQALAYPKAVRSLVRSGAIYRITLKEEQVYFVSPAEEYINDFAAWWANPFIGHPLDDAKITPETPIAAGVNTWHLQTWLVSWATQTLASEICVPYEKVYWFHRRFWENPSYWIHPAQSLIKLLLYSHEEETQGILGWNNAFVQEHYDRIQDLKAEHAAQYLQYCREHATELAGPALQTKSKDELLRYGEHYHIQLRKSWKNDRMIEVLTTSGPPSTLLANEVLEIPDTAPTEQAS